jgi:enoyl-[acyl-carrier protein] reductase II
VPRALRTPFIEEWQQRRNDAKREAERLQGEVITAMQQERFHEMVPFAGQTAGLIREILPAGEIVRSIVAEAEEALKRVTQLLA